MKKTERFHLLIVTLFVIITIFNACKPEPEPDNNTTGSVKVTTNSVSNITETSAKCGGTVTASGYSVGSCGLCYSELPNPTINSYITSDQVGTGTFTSTMSGLEPGTKYYVRAYATTDSEIFYGEQKEFTTLGDDNGGDDNGGGNGGDDNDGDDEPTSGTINGHEWVDLGLPSGLKWATCNVGANSPEEYGDYYGWGKTETESTSANATYGLSISQLQSQGYIDGSGDLAPSHDAAAVNWGGSWRMPTSTEFQELIDHCEWELTQINDITGLSVIGTNGNYIFIPTAGYCVGTNIYHSGYMANYWSSTVYDNTICAYEFKYYRCNESLDDTSRGDGLTVRPVSE